MTAIGRNWPGRSLGAVALAITSAAVADVPRVISFQGRLPGRGDESVSLQVTLYDSAAGPDVLFSEIHVDVQLSDGVFSIQLGAQTPGGIPDSALDSPTLWLGLRVDDGAELSPRTRIGMVPYAGKAASAEQLVQPGTMNAVLTVGADGDVRTDAHVGIGGGPFSASQLVVQTDVLVGIKGKTTLPLMGVGVWGENAAADGETFGVVGSTLSIEGTGVWGNSPHIGVKGTGDDYGVWAEVTTSEGVAVYGAHEEPTGDAPAIYGVTHSADWLAPAVKGEAMDESTGGEGVGVYGVSHCGNGMGVYGLADASDSPDGDAYGGYFATSDDTGDGAGVYGYGPQYGGRFQSSSGTGVKGHHYGSGDAPGVYGVTDSSSGFAAGVRGEATSDGGETVGVHGISYASDGHGVYGEATCNWKDGVHVGVTGTYTHGLGYGVFSLGNARVFGDLTVTGAKDGYVADVVLNGDTQPLERGDLVEIVGHADAILGDVPVIVVRKTRSGPSRAVLGPVDCALNLAPVKASPAANQPPVGYAAPQFHIQRADGAVAPGAYARVVTLGAFGAIKADAAFGSIDPGDLLVSSPNAGFAMVSEDPKIGTVIGKALAPLETGTGMIPILVQAR